jgi:hypothetical protein
MREGGGEWCQPRKFIRAFPHSPHSSPHTLLPPQVLKEPPFLSSPSHLLTSSHLPTFFSPHSPPPQVLKELKRDLMLDEESGLVYRRQDAGRTASPMQQYDGGRRPHSHSQGGGGGFNSSSQGMQGGGGSSSAGGRWPVLVGLLQFSESRWERKEGGGREGGERSSNGGRWPP